MTKEKIMFIEGIKNSADKLQLEPEN